jgi:hypothetical protein
MTRRVLRRVLRRGLAGAVAVAATLAIVALSRVPWAADAGDAALIRLSWRYASEYVEACRQRTAEELERRPAHMRRPEVCDGRLLPYRLEVVLNGDTVLAEWVRGRGAREDRPLAVLHELRVAPGTHELEVRWTPEAGAERPPQVVAARLTLAAREVALITYDVDERRLVARRAPGAGG